MAKGETAVFMGATGNISFAAANVVVGLEKYCADFFDKIIIYYDQWDISDIDAIRTLSEKIEFRLYDNDFFKSRYAGKFDVSNWAARTFTHMVHCKYEIFNLLDEFSNVLWLDCDVLINRDLSSVSRFGDCALKQVTGLATQCYQTPKGYDDDVPAFNTGVIWMTDKVVHEDVTDRCYQLLGKHYDHLKMVDQAVFSMIFHDLEIDVSRLDDVYNYKPNALNLDAEPYIVHANLQHGKFWKSSLAALLFPEWHANDELWVKAGGKPYSGNMMYLHRYSPKISESFNILENSLFWEKHYKYFMEGITPSIYMHYDFSKKWLTFYLKGFNSNVLYVIENRRNNFRVKLVLKGLYANKSLRDLVGHNLEGSFISSKVNQDLHIFRDVAFDYVVSALNILVAATESKLKSL